MGDQLYGITLPLADNPDPQTILVDKDSIDRIRLNPAMQDHTHLSQLLENGRIPTLSETGNLKYPNQEGDPNTNNPTVDHAENALSTARANASQQVDESIKIISTELSQDALQNRFLGNSRALTDPEKASVQDFFNQWLRVAAETFVVSDGESFAITESDIEEVKSISGLVALINKRIQKRIANTIETEVGWFFTISYYRYIEIALWAMFGVAVQGLIRTGRTMAGETPMHEWSIWLNLWMIGKFAYAPILVVAVFFSISLIGPESEALEQFSTNTLATLTIAFILGMHPNTAYRPLRRLMDNVFNPIKRGQSKLKSPPKKVKTKIDKSPKTFGELKSNIVKTLDSSTR